MHFATAFSGGFLITEGLVLLVIIILLLLLSMVWPPDSPWSPWWRTSKAKARIMCRLAKVGKKDVIYDLGSGDGSALITAAKECGATGIGIEIDPSRALIAKLRVRLNKVTKKITIFRKNFFQVEIGDATVIFVYLIPRVLKKLKPKFIAELKPGTRIVTYVYKIPYLPLIAEDKQEKIYVYEIPKQQKA